VFGKESLDGVGYLKVVKNYIFYGLGEGIYDHENSYLLSKGHLQTLLKIDI
jgi:hypothetical protein